MDRTRRKKGQENPLLHIEHWEAVYNRRPAELSSWFQVRPEVSLGLIRSTLPDRDAAIIDVGGGASTLVDHLVRSRYQDITVLDISATALRTTQSRLGDPMKGVHWIECDILRFKPERRYDLWHDRALFHFMTGERQQAAYRAVLERSLAPNGKVVIATFAIDGPERCSGLPVRRYDGDRLIETLGEDFVLLAEELETHLTPGGEAQAFSYFVLARR